MGTDYIASISFTLGVIAPIFLIVLVGLLLRRTGQITPDFIAVASKLVFNICLPLLMFIAITESDVQFAQSWRLAVFSAVFAACSFFVAWFVAGWAGVAPVDRGVAVQSAFRSNLGIIGIALCANAYGQAGLAVGALILAAVTPLYNVFSIYALTRCSEADKSINWLSLTINIVKNPLVMSILLAFVCVALNWRLPAIVHDAGSYLSRMTLPLALLTIGGSLSLTALKASSRLSTVVVFSKLVVVPLAVGAGAWWFGFRGIELGCLVLMFASPTAAAAFVMARAIGGNAALASNTIALSTLLSLVTLSVYLYWLVAMGAVTG